jgi:hypothetical protein
MAGCVAVSVSPAFLDSNDLNIFESFLSKQAGHNNIFGFPWIVLQYGQAGFATH